MGRLSGGLDSFRTAAATTATRVLRCFTLNHGGAPVAMLTKLLSLRYAYVIAVIITLINSILFLFVGVRYSFEGWSNLYRQIQGENIPNARMPLLESLDWFLVALVFLIFSLGMAKIFIGYEGRDEDLPEWLRIGNFKELKVLLWEAIMVT